MVLILRTMITQLRRLAVNAEASSAATLGVQDLELQVQEIDQVAVAFALITDLNYGFPV